MMKMTLDSEEEEVALVVRKLWKMYKYMKNVNFKGQNKKFSNKATSHKCGSTNHLIKEFPRQDQRKEHEMFCWKEQGTKASLSKSNVPKTMILISLGRLETEEEEEQQNEETVNLCLMANTDIKEDEKDVEVSQHIFESGLDGKTRFDIYDLFYEAILEDRHQREKRWQNE